MYCATQRTSTRLIPHPTLCNTPCYRRRLFVSMHISGGKHAKATHITAPLRCPVQITPPLAACRIVMGPSLDHPSTVCCTLEERSHTTNLSLPNTLQPGPSLGKHHLGMAVGVAESLPEWACMSSRVQSHLDTNHQMRPPSP
jgi:hypothetical protein